VVEPPIPARVEAPAPISFAADPIVVAFGRNEESPAPPVTEPAPHEPVPAGRRHRRRIEALSFAAALVLLVGGAIAGADIITGGSERPTLERAVYDDANAGFSVRYPTSWRVVERDEGTGIRFAIGAAGAPTTETNTVSVNVGSTPAALPELHTLADQLTEKLRTELGSVELVNASRAQLAGAPALHFAFRDPDTSPATTIEQYVGRTTAGRPLTITITVREPRTAPTDAELRKLVESVVPA
jgi:hypothetical protein